MAVQQWPLWLCVGCLLINGSFGRVEWNTTKVQKLVSSTRQGTRRLGSFTTYKSDYSNYGRAVAELAEALSPERLAKLAGDYKEAYRAADPFPHIHIDGMFPESTLRLLSRELPEKREKGTKCWIKAAQCYGGNVGGKGSKRVKVDPHQFLKGTLENENIMGLHTKVVFDMLKGSAFVKFLEELSGISQIIADPHYRGSGVHVTSAGGMLKIDSDFNTEIITFDAA